MHRIILTKIFITFYLLIVSLAIADDYEMFCPKKLSYNERRTLIYNEVIKTYQTIQNNYINNNIWNKDFIDKDSELKNTLYAFETGQRGNIVKKLKLSNMKSQEIHELLISHNFTHSKIPLKIHNTNNKFWLRDGNFTEDINHKDLIYVDVYVHSDGSLVRVKSFGIPDKKENALRREPHLIKAVLKNLCKICENGNCSFDISYKNEAFKVTELGYSVPKSPNVKSGLKLIYKNYNLGKTLNSTIINTVADLSHIKIVNDCPSYQLELNS